jgi:hypothetical protein
MWLRAAPIRLAFGSQARPEFVPSCAITAPKRCPGNRPAKILVCSGGRVGRTLFRRDALPRVHGQKVRFNLGSARASRALFGASPKCPVAASDRRFLQSYFFTFTCSAANILSKSKSVSGALD